jgi:leucyl-tRNA synthetase
MEYNFTDIESRWQKLWEDASLYKVSNQSDRPAFYVLDMFPYPSGAGLHVGHPLGYIASDIYARFKRLMGFNVLHPMGYDAFGLPAEQYAIEHGIHPAVSTEENIENFRRQLDKIGFSFDWSRQVKTSDPGYYRWTQWIFLQLFKSWYNPQKQKAENIDQLVAIFEREGNLSVAGKGSMDIFSASQWKQFEENKKMEILMEFRLAYCSYGEVNWCEALGTVLANDEVVNGVSERGGYPVVKKKLRQWYLRITEYADRLLEGLEKVEFSESMKEMQSNWIGKSFGAEIDFKIKSLTPNPSPAGEGSRFFQTADNAYWQILKQFGRENRKDPTPAERILWEKIRNNQLGYKARRQHAIGGFIVDFAILETKLVIEIDGEYHNEKEQLIYDEARTAYLEEHGLNLLRFSNDEVINNIDGVLKRIRETISNRAPLLRPEKGRGDEALNLKVYTTRPDTLFGVDFMVLSPEHELVDLITTTEQRGAVTEYIDYVKSRSERERIAEKKISGCFTGAFVLHPFDDREIPVWISEYVLAGYGTGAIMAVPCGDERDHKFAMHFGIPVTNIIGQWYNGEEANPTKEAILENSNFLNGIRMADAIDIVLDKIESLGIGKRKVNYKMRDASFSRQRYWGEPFPIVWKDGVAFPLNENELPLELPREDQYKPGPEGEGPLANIKDWVDVSAKYGGGQETVLRETNTMPGYAGSSWYFFRYMNPDNQQEFCSRKASDYWGQVDLYIGGTEHAVGHLLYSRMWTKVLFDLGYVGIDEPYKKLVNQGMIQGSSRFVYRLQVLGHAELETRLRNEPVLISEGIKNKFFTEREHSSLAVAIKKLFDFELPANDVEVLRLHVDVNYADGLVLDIPRIRKWKPDFENAHFVLEDGSIASPNLPHNHFHSTYVCGAEVEKMSKSKFNTVNPDDLVQKYGADTFRMYEMFLGPVEQSKPWDTKGIEGVHRFLKKLWRLFYEEAKGRIWNNENPSEAEWKILHRTIKKIEEDTERFSFNTAVSACMIAVNELTELKCHSIQILKPLLIILAPYAPYITEELYHLIGAEPNEFILNDSFPKYDPSFLVESEKNYPVAINGKTRTELSISLEASQEQVERLILANETVKKWLEGKSPKKIIYVKNKMINVVV